MQNSQPLSYLSNVNGQQLQEPCNCAKCRNITPVPGRQPQPFAQEQTGSNMSNGQQQQQVSRDYSKGSERTAPRCPERQRRENVAPACPNLNAENENGSQVAVAEWAAKMLGSGSLILNEIWQSLDGIKRIRKELSARAKGLKQRRQEVGQVRGQQDDENSCGQRWKEELQVFEKKLLEWQEHNRRLGEVPSDETARLFDVTAKLLTRMSKELGSAYRMVGENERLREYVREQERLGTENGKGTMSGLRRWVSEHNLPEPPQQPRQPRASEEPKLSDLGRWIRSRYPPAREQAQQPQRVADQASRVVNQPQGSGSEIRPVVPPTGSEEQPPQTRHGRPGTQSRKSVTARNAALLRSRARRSAEAQNDNRRQGQASNNRSLSLSSSSEENRPRKCATCTPLQNGHGNSSSKSRNDDRPPAINANQPQGAKVKIRVQSPSTSYDSFEERLSPSRCSSPQRPKNGTQARTSARGSNAAQTWNDAQAQGDEFQGSRPSANAGTGQRPVSPLIPPSPFAPYPDSDDSSDAYLHPRFVLARLNVHRPTNDDPRLRSIRGFQSRFSKSSAGSDNVERRSQRPVRVPRPVEHRSESPIRLPRPVEQIRIPPHQSTPTISTIRGDRPQYRLPEYEDWNDSNYSLPDYRCACNSGDKMTRCREHGRW